MHKFHLASRVIKFLEVQLNRSSFSASQTESVDSFFWFSFGIFPALWMSCTAKPILGAGNMQSLFQKNLLKKRII